MKKSNAYWERRANARMAEYHKSSDETIIKINKAYDKVIKDINDDINKIFFKFQTDSGLTLSETRDLLNSKIPKKELDSIKLKINGIQDEDLKKYLMAQLNSEAYKARISRLEALKQSVYINTKIAADVEISQSTRLYTDNIRKAYYANLYDIQKGTGLGFSVAQMPVQTVQEILRNKWSGKHYSKRIWRNTDVLAEKLEEIITSGLMSGKSSRKMAKELRDQTDYGKFAAERLIRTETTYVVNAAEMESYKEADIDKYIFVATLDMRTSEICREMDGKIIEVDKVIAGENLPPLHPYCRSTTRAYFENMERLQRRARDPKTGKTQIIPGDMTYQQWHDKYVTQSNRSNSFEDKVNGAKTIEELNNVTLDKQKSLGIAKVDLSGANINRAKEISIQFNNLSTEYNTEPIVELSISDRLLGKHSVGETIRGSKGKECIIRLKESDNVKYITKEKYKNIKSGDGILNFDVVVDEDKANISTITHEFAHAFGDSTQGNNKEFWKEIKGVRNLYAREMKAIDKKSIVDKSISYDEAKLLKNQIFISEYANKSIDEFMAEAFTEAKLSSNPSKYSMKVLGVIDKYFKKK
ncbi:minor capsid protein [Clostridium sp. UBA1652]|uniref:minor capsid protein n=1 Tax=Clostridium sp. UBA1652 TaxID=1946348 RepID=UPI0025803AD6|nr:minor capsid protein [Clostridium sp. UBA1652]